ncbi:MAG: FAD-dependent oxidoreductase [Stellaceae bacterium]
MLIDLREMSDDRPQFAETLIVGSGAVGLTMAIELARAGRSVIVLEAGGATVETKSQNFFKTALCSGHQLPGLHLGRYRAFGGTTNFWGGQLLEFDPIVFENRHWVTDVSWPITRQELDPFYARGYELLGMSHRLSDEMVWRRLNIEPPAVGDELDSYFSLWAPQPNLASLFRSEIKSRDDLRVFVNAPVVGLELDQSRERVTSVVVRTIAGGVRRFSAERVILANGTIEIARLLKMALFDGRSAPWSGNRRLGRGFVDHIDCFGGYVTPLDKKRFHDLFDNTKLERIKYVPKLKLSEQAQRSRKLLGVTAFFLFNSRFQEHLGNLKLLARSLFRGHYQRQLVPNPREFISSLRVAFPMILRYLRDHRVYNLDEGIQLRLMGEQLPVSESALHLGVKSDHLGMPIVELDWRIDGREIETLAIASELVAHYLEKHQLASVRLDPALVARDRSAIKQWRDYYHHMGMARMANTPSDGVVDRNLKVFGTGNLYVAGAAVYPSTGFANPTFTAIALGLRLARAICSGVACA